MSADRFASVEMTHVGTCAHGYPVFSFNEDRNRPGEDDPDFRKGALWHFLPAQRHADGLAKPCNNRT